MPNITHPKKRIMVIILRHHTHTEEGVEPLHEHRALTGLIVGLTYLLSFCMPCRRSASR